METVSLPSRYEDIEEAYRGRLEPNPQLIEAVQRGLKSMEISGGIRFLPIYGVSGSGKSCASRELDKHLPETRVALISHSEIENQELLVERIVSEEKHGAKCIICVIDQFEEQVSGRENIPTEFVEKISLLDRSEFRGKKLIFVWLTTDRDFQAKLEEACSRNARLLLQRSFTITGPDKGDWSRIVEETFSFHNHDRPLADFGIVSSDIDRFIQDTDTIGMCFETTAEALSRVLPQLQDLSEYQVILLWPVADETRMQRVLQFTRPREGYLLNWDAWKRELNSQDQATLPLHEYNRARLYFDMRLIPIRAADIHRLCTNLDEDLDSFGNTYIDWFKRTHFYHICSGTWKKYDYSPVRARESERSRKADAWYKTVTTQPTKIGRRLSAVFSSLGEQSEYEKEITTIHSTVKADVYLGQNATIPKNRIIEMKVFASENTMPSSIKEQIKVTMRRHAQFAGFLSRQ